MPSPLAGKWHFAYTRGARLTCSEMQSKWSLVLRLFILHHAVEQSSTTISDHLELDLDKNEYKIALPPRKLQGILTKNNNAKPFRLLGSRPLLSFASLFHSRPMVFLPEEFPQRSVIPCQKSQEPPKFPLQMTTLPQRQRSRRCLLSLSPRTVSFA